VDTVDHQRADARVGDQRGEYRLLQGKRRMGHGHILKARDASSPLVGEDTKPCAP
jgi:hypothetical protein